MAVHRDPSDARSRGPREGTGSRRRRTRAAHLGPERRRPLVLDSAFELFRERGYEGTSMAAIAEAAGVTKPVVYDCYPSKEGLFSALLAREEERVLADIAEAIASALEEGGDLEQTLVRALTAFLSGVERSPDAYRIVFLGEGGANAAVARRAQRGRERQVEAIAALARPLLGGLAVDDELDARARLIGHVSVGLAEAGARAMLSDPERWTPEELGESLGRLAADARLR